MSTPTILEDDREIRDIWVNDQQGWYPDHGCSADTCTHIVAYGEPDKWCNVAWFAVYNGDDLVVRVPAYKCETVRYKC